MTTNWQIGDRMLDPNTGQGRWEIYRILCGGMGIVYIVYDHDPGYCEPFAAKTFQDEIFETSLLSAFCRKRLRGSIWRCIRTLHRRVLWKRSKASRFCFWNTSAAVTWVAR